MMKYAMIVYAFALHIVPKYTVSSRIMTVKEGILNLKIRM